MRYVIAITVLAFLAAVPVRAQQETGQQKTSAPTTTEQMDDAADAQLASDWTKIQSHWKEVEAANGAEKTKLLDAHRTMLGDFTKKLEEHEKMEEEGKEATPDDDAAKLAEVDKHWKMVESIKDPEQLETHLKMHQEMLAPIVADEGDYGEDMDHDDMGHGAEHAPGADQTKPEKPDKPAGY